MLFNSIDFLLFFPAICILYWIAAWAARRWCETPWLPNTVLLVGSYYFYMCWKPEYALLLLLSTAVTYAGGLAIAKAGAVRARKWCVAVVCLINIGMLVWFKYWGFLAQAITHVLQAAGLGMSVPGFDVLLPVGISFYIFQALGYTIDVYRGKVQAERDFCTYALFVSFFPQLVAGPIERSTHLLGQFKTHHRFVADAAIAGFKLMLWGYLMKVCLADRAAYYVDMVYNNIDSHQGYSALVAVVLFPLQIYGDFAGYSCIAIGAAMIMGYHLNDNFRQPYFSVSVSEFWRRWHISLSSWLTDYVYIPLGGSRHGTRKTLRNLMATFTLSGLWHGASWTYVIWGMLHGLALCAERLLGWNKRRWRTPGTILHWCLTIGFVMWTFPVFRAPTIDAAIQVIKQALTPSDLSLDGGLLTLGLTLLATAIVFCYDLYHYRDMAAGPVGRVARSRAFTYVWCVALIVYIGIFGAFETSEFIYFQF